MAKQFDNNGVNIGISWTHYTVNLWWGCMAVSPGCTNCYAETIDKRWGGDHWGAKAPRRIVKGAFDQLRHYQKEAAAAGEMRRVFVGSMMDIFEKSMPLVDAKGQEVSAMPNVMGGTPLCTGDVRFKLFRCISAGLYPNLMFLLLTKRPGNILKYIPESWKQSPPANVMYGTSPVNQETADDMIPKLLAVPGKHFLSCEPLLGVINLHLGQEQSDVLWRRNNCRALYSWISKIDWVIVGGESGHYARPMHPDWAQYIRDQCAQSSVPFFFKQWGEYLPCIQAEFLPSWHDPEERDHYKRLHKYVPDAMGNYGDFYKTGKGPAGHLLDGKEYHQFPL
jgi:protein gp37